MVFGLRRNAKINYLKLISSLTNRSRFIIDPSYASIEDLNFGRIAFHGMNPEIEKMAENERIRREEMEAAK